MIKQKRSLSIILLIITVALATLSAVGYFVYLKKYTKVTYINKGRNYGFQIKYNPFIVKSIRETGPTYIGGGQLGSYMDLGITSLEINKINLRVFDSKNDVVAGTSCSNNQTLKDYEICKWQNLADNPRSVGERRFGNNNFIYADITGGGEKSQYLFAFIQRPNERFIYEFYIWDPSREEIDLFHDILSSFTFFNDY